MRAGRQVRQLGGKVLVSRWLRLPHAGLYCAAPHSCCSKNAGGCLSLLGNERTNAPANDKQPPAFSQAPEGRQTHRLLCCRVLCGGSLRVLLHCVYC